LPLIQIIVELFVAIRFGVVNVSLPHVGHPKAGKCLLIKLTKHTHTQPVWVGQIWLGIFWLGLVWYNLVWYGVVWFDVVEFGFVWMSMVWCG